MQMAKAQGYDYNTKENMQFVKDHWNEFRITQVANNALAKNEISRGRGKLGVLGRLIFGVMQGANRAAYASTINKLEYWKQYKVF